MRHTNPRIQCNLQAITNEYDAAYHGQTNIKIREVIASHEASLTSTSKYAKSVPDLMTYKSFVLRAAHNLFGSKARHTWKKLSFFRFSSGLIYSY